MNQEIEKKYRVEAGVCESIRQHLLANGEVKGIKARSVDTYFVVSQEIPNTRYLRLRVIGDNSSFAYHEVESDLVTNEWESAVENASTMHEALVRLGFPVDVTVDKKREKYILDSCEVVIDEIEGLGWFVEVEAPSLEALEATASILGLEESSVVAGVGYPDLVREHAQSAK